MLKVRKTFPVVDLSLESMSNTTITIQIRKLSSLPFNKINNKSSHPSLDNSTNFASALLIITSLFPIYHFYFWWDLVAIKSLQARNNFWSAKLQNGLF